MADRIQLRRDSAANWTSANPVLAQGEIGVELGTRKLKVGDGAAAWNALPYVDQTSGQSYVIGADPTPQPNTLHFYAGKIAERHMPRFMGPSGLSSFVQPFLARNNIGFWRPPGGAVTVPGVLGYGALTAVGTATARPENLANAFRRTRRLGYVSAATPGALASLRQTVAQVALGDGSGFGGFLKVVRFGISDAAPVADARMFVGMAASVAAPTNVEPSTLLNVIGVGHGAADTTLRIYAAGAIAQPPIDLGANFPANTQNADMYELALFSPPAANGDLFWEVTRLNTGQAAAGYIGPSNGNNLPGVTTLLSYMWAYRANNATAAAVGLDLFSDYIETDY